MSVKRLLSLILAIVMIPMGVIALDVFAYIPEELNEFEEMYKISYYNWLLGYEALSSLKICSTEELAEVLDEELSATYDVISKYDELFFKDRFRKPAFGKNCCRGGFSYNGFFNVYICI